MTATLVFPLSWPAGWPRTPAASRAPARFRTRADGIQQPLSLAGSRDRLDNELMMLAARDAVLSTNLVLNASGSLRTRQAEPEDPGVAVHFMLRRRPTVLACDRWDRVGGNIGALAAHIDALRGMDRWGVGSVEQAFTGYAALPAPLAPDDWRVVLRHPATLDQAEAAFRLLARTAHPDLGGSHSAMSALVAAITRAREVMRDA